MYVLHPDLSTRDFISVTPLAHDFVQEMVMGENEPSWYDIVTLTFLGTHISSSTSSWSVEHW